MSEAVKLASSRPPQYYDRASTSAIMWTVTACLLPSAAWGVYIFGVQALSVLGASVLAAVVTEGLIARVADRETLRDGSAVLAGLLIGMTMPPGVPLFVPVVASVFAMSVVKWSFGGLGTNWMNPALAGRVFVLFSWTGSMTTWMMPRTLLATGQAIPDSISSATPLGIVQAGRATHGGAHGGPLSLLHEAGYPVSRMDVEVTEWLNVHVLSALGINLPSGYVDPFVGNMPGSIGEVSALLLLLGSVVLFARRIIVWQIPTAYFFTFAVLTRVLGGVADGQGFLSGDVLFAALTGGVMLAVFYMATDPVTSPLSRTGMLIYGAGAGLLTFVLRAYGRFPESAALAIILMNIVVPLIDRATRSRRFGVRSRAGQGTRDPDQDAARPIIARRAGASARQEGR